MPTSVNPLLLHTTVPLLSTATPCGRKNVEALPDWFSLDVKLVWPKTRVAEHPVAAQPLGNSSTRLLSVSAT